MTGIFSSESVNLSLVEQEVYQATTKQLVASIIATNKTFGGLPVVLKHVRGNKTTEIARDRMPSSKSKDLLVGRLVLKPNDKIIALCPIAGAIDVLVSTLDDAE